MNTDAAAPAFSMGKQKRGQESRPNRDFKLIGPGSYDMTLADKKKEPQYSMGAKVQTENSKLNVPGAGTYQHKEIVGKETQGKTMGSKLRLKQLQGVLGPGPGGYQADKQKKHNLAFSMGSKLEDLEFKKKNFAPGPGRYDQEKKHSIPSMKFGTGTRASLDGGKEAGMKPGPNVYSADPSKVQRQSPKFGFGSEKRAAESKLRLSVPGPGNYMAKTFTGVEGSKFSMGATLHFEPHRKEQKFKPGPGNYSPNSSPVTKKESAWKIGSAVRQDLAFEKAKGFQTSPGQYDPDVSKVKNKAAGWRIGTEQRPGMVTKGHEQYPGAGSYPLPSSISEGPKIGMHAKTDTVDQNVKKNVPGPGKYDLQNSPNQKHSKSPAFSLGTSQREPLGGGKDSVFKPGPGRYNQTIDFKKAAPMFAFGRESRPELGRGKHQNSPGPGAYRERPVTGVDGPSLTMSPKYEDKFKDKRDKLVPGPGQYEFHLKAMRTAPNYRIGTSQRVDPSKANTTKGVETDAGKYNPSNSQTQTASPNYRFGSQHRRMYDDKVSKTIPAPGHYTINKGAFSKKGILMGEKLKSLSSLQTPGAGTYNQDVSPTRTLNPRFSMGLKLKNEFAKLNVPGPGTYVNSTERLRQSAPSYGFGSSKRPEIGKNKNMDTPGPGNYKLLTKIGNVPDFAMPGRSPENKFV